MIMVVYVLALLALYAGIALSLKKMHAKQIAVLTLEQGKLTEQMTRLKSDVEFWQKEAVDLANEVEKEKDYSKKILSQKKSSETRLGQVTENIVPFLDAFPYDPKNAHFLGQPIDFIVFDYDDGKITFVEVKTGNAKESHRQKLIKNIIKSGRVYYERIRINEKGIKIKEEKNNE